MARKKRHEEKVNLNRWMVTYADFVTLMFAFFTVLFATSTVDVRKSVRLSGAIMEALGWFEGTPETSGIPLSDPATDETVKAGKPDILGEEFGILTKMTQAVGEAYQKAGRAKVDSDERGIIVSMADTAVFRSGEAEILSEAMPVLDKVAEVLSRIPNEIRVEGHTDDVPIQSAYFSSNWELSTARAVSIVRYFIEHHQLNPQRLVAAGYGEFHPADSNATEEGRAKNRRAEIVIVSSNLSNRRETGSPELETNLLKNYLPLTDNK